MPRVNASSSTAGFAPPAQQTLMGIAALLLSLFFLTGLDGIGKWLMAAGVPLLILSWVRYIVHILLLLAVILPSRGLSVFKSKLPKLQFLRAVAMLGATLSFFTTLSYLHQAEATALIFIAPLMMLSVAPWILKEPPRKSRWIAAAIGLIGVLIVIRPSSGLHPMGVFMGLVTACLFTAQHTLTRLVAHDSAFTTVLWSGAIATAALTLSLPFTLPAAWDLLAELSILNWMLLLLCGVVGAVGHLLQIQSYRYAPASLLAPFIYLQITFAATLGWLIWSHLPDATTWLGIAIICASGVGNSLIEWRRSRA
ncbi:DMT family transporter [Zwartia sp.]|uniref:DMT family transporter n=1 Tax=Zwartia sp. TaxID=2978004 RepID=UPI0027218143|nr:DMT family transporter [Zwartia sp.]MDO9023255.1 DMT family transporter [Zwartia sp.]